MDPAQQRLLEMKAEMIQAVAHPIRLAIVELLQGGEECVCDIARRVGAKRSNVSRHLALMQRAGVLECRKDGLRVLYRLRTPCLLSFLSCVSEALRERLEQDQAALSQL